MVFESLVSYVLNRFLGDYIENLDTKQLKLGIWGGDVVLTDLYLKQTALKEFDLPIQHVYGQLSKLTLKIPWTNIYNSPVEATVDGLYILVVPNTQIEYNEEKEAKKLMEWKQKQLQAVEKVKKKVEEKTKTDMDSTLVERVGTRIIENVQVTVKNIHVRFEHKVTNPNSPFAMGITLSSLSLQSTDEKWMSHLMPDDEMTKIFKVLDMQGFSVYWNCKSEIYREFTPEELLRRLQNEIATKTRVPPNYTYILGPVHSTARIKLNPKPDRDSTPFVIPKLVANLEMEKLSIALTKDQYTDLIRFSDSLIHMKKSELYRKYRPKVPYKGHYKEWWHFAYNCILEFEVKRKFNNWNWNYILKHRNMCREYVYLYKQKLQTKKVSPQLQEQIYKLEKELDVFNLVLVRHKAELEVERYEKQLPLQKSRSWFSWWGKAPEDKAPASKELAVQFQAAMTPEEKQRFYKAIDYQEHGTAQTQPIEYVDLVCSLMLKRLQIDLYDEKNNLLCIYFLTTKCKVEARVAAKALAVRVSIGQLTANGMTQNGYTPKLISLDSTEDGDLCSVVYEKNPLNSTCGRKVRATMKPLKVIYDAVTINSIIDVFKMPESSTTHKLSTVAAATLDTVKIQSTAGLQLSIDTHMQLDIEIDLYAPYVIIPYGGMYTETENIVVINLGHIRFVSKERRKSSKRLKSVFSTQEEFMNVLMEEGYDKFFLEFTNLQILIVPGGNDWHKIMEDSIKTDFHILHPLNFHVELYTCLVDRDPRLPRCRIISNLPSLALNMVDYQVILLLGLVTSIPLPNMDKAVDEPSKLEDSYLSRRSSQDIQIFDFTHEEVQTSFSLPQEKSMSTTQIQQLIDLDAYFILNDLSVKFKRQEYSASLVEEIAAFEMQSLEAKAKVFTFTREITITLDDILFTKYQSGYHIPIISSKEGKPGDYLFQINFVKVDKKSPEFVTIHNRCESLLTVKVETIKLNLHLQALQSLMAFGANVQIQLDDILERKKMKTLAFSGSSNKLPSVQEGVSHTPTFIAKKTKGVLRGTSSQNILFMLDAKLCEFQIIMGGFQGDILSLVIRDIMSQVILKQASTRVDAVLTYIHLVDLDPKTKYVLIVQGLCEELVNFSLVLHKKQVDTTRRLDMEVILSMGCIRFVFLNIFASRILDFVKNFKKAEAAILDASRAAADTAKHNVTVIYKNAVQMSLNIDLEAPQIIIPEKSSSLKALMIDLGHFIVRNDLVALYESNDKAIVDNVEMKLSDIHISRIELNAATDVINRIILLQPVNITVLLRRNLSSAWYNAIPDIQVTVCLELIEIVLAQTDYIAIAGTILGNLAEVPPKEPKIDSGFAFSPANTDVCEKSEVIGDHPEDQLQSILEKVSKVLEKSIHKLEVTTHIIVKFDFLMKNFTIKLFSVEDTIKDPRAFDVPTQSFAMFSLENLSVKGVILSNSSIRLSLLLVDCVVQDTRAGKEDKLNKMFSRGQHYIHTGYTCQNMIDAAFEQKKNTVNLGVSVTGFNLILSMEFIVKLLKFLTSAFKKGDDEETEPKTRTTARTAKNNAVKSPHNVSRAATKKKSILNITVNIKLGKPDIVIVEQLDNVDTNALILNFEVLMKARLSGSHRVFNGRIKDIHIYTCCYNPAKREATKVSILPPFSITVTGLTPEGKRLHIEVYLTEIRIKVSPTTVKFLNRIRVALLGAKKDEVAQTETLNDLSKLWQATPFQERRFWFFKTDIPEELIDLAFVTITEEHERLATIDTKYNEICIITLPLLLVTIEMGEGRSTLPVLILESTFGAHIQNWTSEITIDAFTTLQMAYYNSEIAVWEPLIEPVGAVVENAIIYKPWELKIAITTTKRKTNDQDATTAASNIEIGDMTSQSQPKKCIEISSSNNLELTISTTAIDILMNLGNSFLNAVTLTVLKPPEEAAAPYKFVNESGLVIKVDFEKSNYIMYQNSDAKHIILKHKEEVALQPKEPTKINFTLNDILSSLNTDDKFLYITVMALLDEIKLNLVRLDTRYFSLDHRGSQGDTLGIIISTMFEEGSYKVIFSSIVKIYNHLETPVNVYHKKPPSNNLELTGTVTPNGVFYIPLHAVYTNSNQLFFSIQNYSISRYFVWKDVKMNVNLTQILDCLPIASLAHSAPFVIKAVGSLEQVYEGNSVKKTMQSIMCNINLYAPILFRNCLPYDTILKIQNLEGEIPITPGSSLPITSVTPGVSRILVRLPNYLEKDWSCDHEISINPPRFAVWGFNSYDSSLQVSLQLGVHTTDTEGPTMITLYCPYWMMNKSELNIAYREFPSMATETLMSIYTTTISSCIRQKTDEDIDVLHHPANFKDPILFSISARDFFGRKRAAIKIESRGEWSDSFLIDAAGSSGIITCKYDEKIYQFGVNIKLTTNGLTKQVTFTPYYVLINNAPFTILCQEYDQTTEPWIPVGSKSCSPLWPLGDFDDKLLRIRVAGTKEVSSPFFITENHSTFVRLDNHYGGVQVETQITEGAIYITFARYESGMAPALIINHTWNTMNIWEKDTVHLIKLDPGHMMYYTWSKPSGARVLCWEAGYRKEIEDDLRKDGSGYYAIAEDNNVYWTSFLNEMQRTLLFTCNGFIAADAQSSQTTETINLQISCSIFGIGLSLVNNSTKQEVMYIGIVNSDTIWEIRKTDSSRYRRVSSRWNSAMETSYRYYLDRKAIIPEFSGIMTIIPKVEVNFDTNEMINPHQGTIRRRFRSGLWVQLTTCPYVLKLHAKINRIQIDNQIYNCMFPVVLAPVWLERTVAGPEMHRPFIELSIVQLIKRSHIKQFKYFKLLIQEFHVKLELGFIVALADIFQLSQETLEKQKQKFLSDVDTANLLLYEHLAHQAMKEQKSFYDFLHFSPLKIHVYFSIGGHMHDVAPNSLIILLQSIGVTLTDMNDVIFRIAYFEREYVFLTQKQLVSEAAMHYVGQTVNQLYALVLGLDVLGNPYGFVLGVTRGVEDFFNEPFEGAMQGFDEFLEGLALGFKSLFGHTVGGACGAVSRMTAAMGKGVAALTFDKDFQKKRRDALNKSATPLERFARSGKALWMGVYDGVTGVAKKPLDGAKEHGVEGFFKGLAKGAAGFFTKPILGVIDFTSGSFGAVKRATAVVKVQINRTRLPRYIHSDGIIRPYSQREAFAFRILLEIEKGKYVTDSYVHHIAVVPKREVVLFTDKRLAFVKNNKLYGFWRAIWVYEWQEIRTPRSTDRGVLVPVKVSKERKAGGSELWKTIITRDKKVADAIIQKITEELQKQSSSE